MTALTAAAASSQIQERFGVDPSATGGEVSVTVPPELAHEPIEMHHFGSAICS